MALQLTRYGMPPHMVLLLRAFTLGGECNNLCLVRRHALNNHQL